MKQPPFLEVGNGYSRPWRGRTNAGVGLTMTATFLAATVILLAGLVMKAIHLSYD